MKEKQILEKIQKEAKYYIDNNLRFDEFVAEYGWDFEWMDDYTTADDMEMVLPSEMATINRIIKEAWDGLTTQ